MKKLFILAIMACCAMLAVSCNNQPKEEEQPAEEVSFQLADTTAQEVVADTTAAAAVTE
ncbi:MAG: hypothetical protein PHD11_08555 [Bacteroidales bacterium]|nr:hypothetical protein [Bacteroidales bacterium]MDD4670292.1 hypothetical protein [Bacteroidales bacterium]